MRGISLMFATALAHDPKLSDMFTALPEEKQRAISERASYATSREEMRTIVNEIKGF